MSQIKTTVLSYLERSGATKIRVLGDGINYIATCPFHHDKSPSFCINSETGQYICYSASCGARGGFVQFLMELFGYTLQNAHAKAEFLKFSEPVKQEDLFLPPFNERKRSVIVENRRSDEAEESIVARYAMLCPTYMLERGFDKKVLRKWEVGWDEVSGSVTFPVRDERGSLIGISRRTTIEAYYGAKYIHKDFSKSTVLYNRKRSSADTVWVGEGNADAIALDQMLHDETVHAVSTFGARVSKRHVDLLSRYKTVILAFDNDADGFAATTFVGDKLLRVLNRGSILVASAYPEDCKDPADILKKHDEETQNAFVTALTPYEMWRIQDARSQRSQNSLQNIRRVTETRNSEPVLSEPRRAHAYLAYRIR